MFATGKIPCWALWALLWLAGMPTVGLATGEITAQMRAEDPRLENRLSVRGDRWYVGELCEHMTRLAAVSIAAHDRDGAADPRVTVVLNDIPLGDAMNALRSLLSYEDAPYVWERSGDAPNYRYVLRRSLKAQRLPEEVTRRIEADFEAECAKLLALCRLNDDELKELAKTDPVADNMVKFPRVAAAWQMLGDVLSPEALSTVLRGEQALTLKVADLPPSGRRFVDTVWSEGERFVLTPEGGRAQAPEPDRVYVHRDNVGPGGAPALMIGLPHAGEYAYAGALPLQLGILRSHLPPWTLDGETATDPREDTVLSRPPKGVAEPADAGSLMHRLAQIAEAAHISILCRLAPPYDKVKAPPPYDKSISQYLDAMGRNRGILQSKWCGDALLISDTGWVRREAAQLPWRTEKMLRKSLAKKDGMSFHEVVALATSLTDQQAQTVAMDHPSLSFLRRPGLFAALGQEPGLVDRALSPEGVPLTGKIAEIIAGLAGADVPTRALALRIVERNTVPVEGADGRISFVAGRGHMWRIELRQLDGTWQPHSAVRRPKEARNE